MGAIISLMRRGCFGRLVDVALSAVGVLLLASSATALAGGSPENALIIIDPSRLDAQYVANYYKNARNIPDANILYMDPGAGDYATFVTDNLDALFGELANDGVADHIDYIVIAPPESFFVSAPGLIADGCSSVNRFSIGSAYTMAFITDEILSGGLNSQENNRYYRNGDAVRFFDSSLTYRIGKPEESAEARRYFIGFCLGYTGSRGNSVGELLSMIDRSVAVDGTFPAGVFYFMQTTDGNRSSPRHGAFPATVSSIEENGGQAEHLQAVLPIGQDDCLGIMTGWASPGIETADLTILPGAICDHLTSFAGTFDTGSQEKMSLWIRRGASGTCGTVEEPCNYAGKFPHSRAHLYYLLGLSLGESIFRSLNFVPFQPLMYGDPLTRPFAHLPVVSVPDAPSAQVSGMLTLTPSATTTDPLAAILGFDLLIDGVLHSSILPGGQFVVDSAQLSDGWHDLRVLGFDDSLVKSTGRWLSAIETSNRGRSISAAVSPPTGDHSTLFTATIAASGVGAPVETRLLHNGRVVAAAQGAATSLSVFGLSLGAGHVTVQAEALYASGERVRSAPQTLNITFATGIPSPATPLAFDFTRRILPESPALIELPATHGNATLSTTYEVLSGPSQATLGPGDNAYRLLRPDPGASGSDQITFRVVAGSNTSNTATVTILYGGPCPADLTGDNLVGIDDLSVLLASYGQTSGAAPEAGDIDRDGDVDLVDLSELLSVYGESCQ